MTDDVRRALEERLAPAQTTAPDGSWSQKAGRNLFEDLIAEGWSRVGLPEALGGSGGSFQDVASVITASAASGHPLPLADSLALGNPLLEKGCLHLPEDAGAVIVLTALGAADASGSVSVEAERVAWASWGSHFVVVTPTSEGSRLNLLSSAGSQITPGMNLAGEPRERVTISASTPLMVADIEESAVAVLREIRLRGALTRSLQMSAAIESAVKLSVQYCSQRMQFGRLLREFQAVQHHLAGLSGESAAARAAVDSALRAVQTAPTSLPVDAVATAKCRTGIAATRVTASSHQVHGAMGITAEYPLQRFSKALWAWRDEFGGESEWAASLLTAVMRSPRVDPWTQLESA